MSSSIPAWPEGFKAVYEEGAKAYRAGVREPQKLFSRGALTFLSSIGCTAQELFDFIDDGHRYGEPSYETTFLVTAIRRDYFLRVMGGKPTGKIVPMSALPAKTDEVRGIAWLPRLIEKARVKLRGEMPDELMYGCAGDRPFLQSVNMNLPDFLKLVWDLGSDNDRIVEAVIAAKSKK